MTKPRQMIWRFLAGITFCLAAFLVAGPAAARTTGQGDIEPAALIPDITIIVSPADDSLVDRLHPPVSVTDGVARATWDTVDGGALALYLAVDDSSTRPVEAIGREAAATVEALVPDEVEVLLGGSSLVDEELADRYRTSARWIVLLAAVIGASIGAAFGGWKRTAGTAAALAAAVLCASSLGAQVAGPFNGTLTNTAVPGALAGLVAGSAVALRLLVWYRRPVGDDGAAIMRRSVADLLPELALVFSGLAISAFVVEFLDPGRSPLTVITVAGFVAVLVIMATMAPMLAVLGPAAPGPLPLAFPDGRDFPLIVVTAIAAVLVALSLFAFGTPAPVLIGGEALDDDSPAAVVAQRLTVGDPTNSLVAVRSAGIDRADFEGWAGAVVERAEVAWVDTASGRLTSTGSQEVPETVLLVPPGRDDVAVIVLAAAARSVDGQELADRLAAIPLAGGPPDFEGEASESARVVGSRATVITAALSLVLVGSGALFVMTQNRALTAMAAVLRLIGSGATLGVLRLMDGDVTTAEAVTTLGLMGLGLGMFELEFLRAVGDGGGTGRFYGIGRFEGPGLLADNGRSAAEGAGPAISAGTPNPGQSAGLALLALAPAGLLLSVSTLFGGGPGTGQFGLALLAAVIIEVLLGLVLVRPALLGQRAAYHSAVRPVRVAMHSGLDRETQDSLGAEDPAWRRIVGDLLQSEFRLQSEPASAVLDSVFVPDTPLFKQAATHHANLAKAGLRIVGRSPHLRTLRTVSGRSSITLAVTVDHPPRQLVDGEGTVVGLRKPERRSGVLWLSSTDDGSYRIAESVELGSVTLPEDGHEELSDPPRVTDDRYQDPAGGGSGGGLPSPSEPLAP